MAYRRETHDAEWPWWLREHRAELTAIGLPAEAYRTKLDWLVFLDHGYVQSTDLHISQWWSVNLLSPQSRLRLAGFLGEQYGARYADLARALRAPAAGGAA